MYKTNLLMDYIHRPVSSIEHDISETGSVHLRTDTEPVSETSGSIEETGRWI
jgi:hypothetical protein